uniref:Uncharacterized protein n=1 Tax=Anguilla anguilla TaxID=7936 RepID=A0A0E9UQC6_ANGAN
MDRSSPLVITSTLPIQSPLLLHWW